jgi:integrase
MAAAPAQNRPKSGKPQYKAAPVGDKAMRARRASANRVLTRRGGRLMRRIRSFGPGAGGAGNRVPHSELTRLEMQDFNPDTSTVAIRKSKSGKPRHVILTPEGADFFQQQYAGRRGSEIMFRHDDGTRWNKSEQSRPIREACGTRQNQTAHLVPHPAAHLGLAVMAGVPLLVVAKNLGHADTRMVEKHYGHLAPSYIADAIRAGAPRFAASSDTTVVPMRKGS